ncbi:CHAT domain-containing protein [Aquabacterium sp.]|uniref:CHAT domain-containing protein n=1 Tax=Aquabacterium sp. TaxID=1872578 RepID=UPI003784BA8B
MGAADRLRSGLTAEAMAAAALRAASSDDTLRDLVREDQDAQRELNVLQEQLAGQDGAALADDGRAAARKRLVALEQRRTELRVLIRGRYPNYDQLASPPLADASGVAQRLAGDEALVFMLPLAQETVIWTVTANELPVVARAPIGRDGLAALSAQLRRSVTFGNGPLPPFDRRAAAELYQRLITPVEGSLATVKHLIVVASGPLGSVPFPALLRTDPADTGRSSWLLDRWTVTQMPTVGAWLTLRSLPPSPAAPEPFIGWGDPAFALGHAPRDARPAPVSRSAMRYGDLATLPESRDELQGIAASLKADAARDLVLGPAATRDSVLAASRAGTLARKRVVVFATHGLGRDDLPGLDQPALAMAATPGDASLLAPLLKLDDVLSLRLNAEWVVLSACNTAAGDGRDDEALTGLARGFLYAGTRTLLATHWAVETESAKRLTTALFEHWAAHPTARKAESHRQAMQALAATPRYAHPAYWAPYVLIGEGRR